MAVCDGTTTGVEYLTDFEFIKAVTCTYADPMGLLVFGLIVYAAIALSIYIRTDSITIPVVLLFLVGGAVTPQLAGPAAAVATVGVLVTGAAALTLVYVKLSR